MVTLVGVGRLVFRTTSSWHGILRMQMASSMYKNRHKWINGRNYRSRPDRDSAHKKFNWCLVIPTILREKSIVVSTVGFLH